MFTHHDEAYEILQEIAVGSVIWMIKYKLQMWFGKQSMLIIHTRATRGWKYGFWTFLTRKFENVKKDELPIIFIAVDKSRV